MKYVLRLGFIDFREKKKQAVILVYRFGYPVSFYARLDFIYVSENDPVTIIFPGVA